MDIQELKSDLLNNKIRPIYVFTGNEIALQHIYIKKLQEITGLEVIKLDCLKQVYNKLGAKTLVKVVPKIYVIRNDEEYFKNEKIWEKVISNKNLKGNIIVFLYSGIDKRTKFCNYHDSVLTEFNFVGDSLLCNRVQAITKWPMQYCQDLVKMCGCNYGRIENELYKLNMLSKINNYSIQTAYLEAKKANMIYEEIGDIIFDFSNAVVDRNVRLAYSLLRKIVKTDEGPIKLLTVLYNGFRNILIVQSTPNNERTEEILGLTKAQIYVSSQKCDRYSLPELVFILQLIQKIEKGIKTGEVDNAFAMEYLLGEIF